jgi:hypothetical protein
MGLLLVYLIACGVVLNGVLLWWGYCRAIGWACELVTRVRA